MKIALVHDYINEFGGAERVLKTLTQIYPSAPIYTAFRVKGSTADKEIGDKKIIESFLAPLLKIGKLYSPLRFLIPVIWGSFDLSDYDLVIVSCSWYVTRGFKVGPNTKVVVYCHTPPRWLYGYETSVGFTKYWPVKIYSAIVGHFIRMYDFKTAQSIDNWIANSKNVADRILKFYRKKATVIYPPIVIPKVIEDISNKKKDYYLIASRLVGAKGIEEAVSIFEKLGKNLKIVGESHGFSNVSSKIKSNNLKNIEFLGRVTDEKLNKLYAEAKAFIALARDEDFGMTVVEAQSFGTPVVAFNGGGFKESVVDGKSGILTDEVSENSLRKAIEKVETTKWNKLEIINNAKKFSKENFIKEIKSYINNLN
ncbi:MAG: glycosyltransferase [Candidatus Woesebacteria bacterium]|nr:glycosyltransferase [Candidatus Woesebacteria bacterium]